MMINDNNDDNNDNYSNNINNNDNNNDMMMMMMMMMMIPNNLEAAYVDQEMNTNDNTKPKMPLSLRTMLTAARPIIGSKQYPNTEHVSEKPVG